MASFHLTVKASEDLSNIWNYTFDEWSEKQADKYLQLLLDVCLEVAEHPNWVKMYEIQMGNLWGYKVAEHIIFFQKISSSEIEVIRILHSSMDLKSKF